MGKKRFSQETVQTGKRAKSQTIVRNQQSQSGKAVNQKRSKTQVTSDDTNVPSTSSQFTPPDERLINQCVTYLLSYHSTQLPIKKADIFSHFKDLNVKSRMNILYLIKKKLSSVYGIKFKKVDAQRYILVNPVDNCFLNDNITPEENFLILILTTLALNKYKMSLDSLEKYLLKLGVSLNSKHAFYGDTNSHLKVFEKQLFLKRVITPETVVFYEWGPRAKIEVDKKRIIVFISELLGMDEMVLLQNENFCEVMEIDDGNQTSSDSSDTE